MNVNGLNCMTRVDKFIYTDSVFHLGFSCYFLLRLPLKYLLYFGNESHNIVTCELVKTFIEKYLKQFPF